MTYRINNQGSLENFFTNVTCSDQQLEQFKFDYQNQIDSKRTYSRILNLNDLVNVLIKRDCNLSTLYNKLNQIGSIVETPEEKRAVLPNIPTNPEQRIDQLIANEIGQKWKNLARELRIPEGKIDEFSISSPRFEDMIYEILRYHRSNNKQCWKIKLCQALEKARRKDLSLEVQQIFEPPYCMI